MYHGERKRTIVQLNQGLWKAVDIRQCAGIAPLTAKTGVRVP